MISANTLSRLLMKPPAGKRYDLTVDFRSGEFVAHLTEQNTVSMSSYTPVKATGGTIEQAIANLSLAVEEKFGEKP